LKQFFPAIFRGQRKFSWIQSFYSQSLLGYFNCWVSPFHRFTICLIGIHRNVLLQLPKICFIRWREFCLNSLEMCGTIEPLGR
jgi:hypothetical protein